MSDTFTFFLLCLALLHHSINAHDISAIWSKHVRYATKTEYQFVASISLKNYGHDPDIEVHVCSGVLITKRHVITLAHCIDKAKKLSDVRVKLGFNDLKFTHKYRLKSWTTYKEWAKSTDTVAEPLEHDVAILKTSIEVTVAEPVTITTDNNIDFYGKPVVTVVWGPKEPVRTARFLKSGVLNIISDVECNKSINDSPLLIKNHILDKSYLCSNLNFGVILEDIDSGSPLLVERRKLVAINDPTYLHRRNVYAPMNVNFHIGLEYYKTFIQNVTETVGAKCWKWKRN